MQRFLLMFGNYYRSWPGQNKKGYYYSPLTFNDLDTKILYFYK